MVVPLPSYELKPGRALRVCLVAGLAAIAGCSTARVYRSYHGTPLDRAGTLVGSRIPGPVTTQVLDRQEIPVSPFGRVWPGSAAERLEETGAARTDSDGPLALADLRTKQGHRAELLSPKSAPSLYLDAIQASTDYLATIATENQGSATDDPREQEARRVYNDACLGFLRASAGTWMRLDQAWKDGLAAQGIDVRMKSESPLWDASRFDHFYFASDYRVLGIENPKHGDGLGVPLIAERRKPPFAKPEEPDLVEKFTPRGLQAYPATAAVRVERAATGEGRIVTVELHDPMRTSMLAFPGASRPLAYDLTTPLAFYFTSLPLAQVTQIGLLRPGVLEKQTGLYMLHPYESGKIPVVLVHGLWSSPDTWHQALNDLRGDPVLRERYQFWVFFYPTGDPILYSAAKLRESLGSIRQTLDPQRKDQAFDQMVLVGHSMGGLLSRLSVTESGTEFWDAIANRPFSDLQAGPSQRAMLSKVFFFSPDPQVKRVVYIATPHHGSSMSSELIGKLGNALIRLPSTFEEIQASLYKQNEPDFFKESRFHLPATSITQLSPKSPTLTVMNSGPVTAGLPYHSIVAQAVPGPAAAGTDFIVSYESSHVSGAVSETIVEGTHACLSKPATIAELKRILELHLQETDHARVRKIGEK